MEHFLLQCPRFHSQHTALRSRLSALAIMTLDMPTHPPGGLRHPHLLERKAHQPSPASAWATLRSVLTCTTYVCLVTPSALGVRLLLRPWNISCINAHASTQHIALHSRLSALAIITRPAHPPGVVAGRSSSRRHK
ncbi:hypothetical protein E2C01_080479 [Portunus trituberculatus]|uniref:Uncharacterized protein n=1 Tax=Portunus trituberculatus TaxID=210409 RepID=A0A5B7ITE1_PORTR|nr:hypothetical protein [Portunus trituberculatus]